MLSVRNPGSLVDLTHRGKITHQGGEFLGTRDRVGRGVRLRWGICFLLPMRLFLWITGRCFLEVSQSRFLLAPNSPLIYDTFVQPALGFQRKAASN